jgi:hypothetical protein
LFYIAFIGFKNEPQQNGKKDKEYQQRGQWINADS